MSRSSEEEEAEYYYKRHPGVNPRQYAQPAGPANPHEGVNAHQYAQPAGPQRQSATERIVAAAKGINQHLKEHAQRINSQPDNGFRGGSGARGRAQQGGNSMAGYARFSNDAPVNEESTMHPGHRIIVVEGSVLASARTPGSAPAQPRRRRSGGMGGDSGFGNDRGL